MSEFSYTKITSTVKNVMGSLQNDTLKKRLGLRIGAYFAEPPRISSTQLISLGLSCVSKRYLSGGSVVRFGREPRSNV